MVYSTPADSILFCSTPSCSFLAYPILSYPILFHLAISVLSSCVLRTVQGVELLHLPPYSIYLTRSVCWAYAILLCHSPRLSPEGRRVWQAGQDEFHFLCLSVCVSLCLCVCLSVCLPACLAGWLAGCLSVCLSLFLSVCLSICLTVCPAVSVYVCVCLSLSLSLSLSRCGCVSANQQALETRARTLPRPLGFAPQAVTGSCSKGIAAGLNQGPWLIHAKEPTGTR